MTTSLWSTGVYTASNSLLSGNGPEIVFNKILSKTIFVQYSINEDLHVTNRRVVQAELNVIHTQPFSKAFELQENGFLSSFSSCYFSPFTFLQYCLKRLYHRNLCSVTVTNMPISRPIPLNRHMKNKWEFNSFKNCVLYMLFSNIQTLAKGLSTL